MKNHTSYKNIIIISYKLKWKRNNKFNKKKIDFILFNNQLDKTNKIIIADYENVEKYENNIYWNNIIIDISSTNLKKDVSYNLKYKNKYLFINKYYLLDNYESIFNLYFKNYEDILLDTKKLSNFIYINKFKLNKDINIINKFIKRTQEPEIRISFL